MKVFLSHSTKDKHFVETLAAELEAEKIEPWLCEVDIEFGQNFVAKIEEGLRDADLAVLFWSPEAAVSAWTQLEWTSVTAREISEARTRLGVVLLRDCAIPELLRVKHRIDARTDPEKGRLETVAWIKRLRDMRRLAEKKAPRVFLPPPPHDFVGRAEALEMLYAVLAEDPGGALLYGEPGCGKSSSRSSLPGKRKERSTRWYFNFAASVPSPRSRPSWWRNSSLASRPSRPRSKSPPARHGLPSAGLCWCWTIFGKTT
jgi:TIR domain-containing protein